MKIEILKSAKGNDHKQNLTCQTPKPRIPKTQVHPHAKRKKTKEKKATKRLAYKPSQT